MTETMINIIFYPIEAAFEAVSILCLLVAGRDAYDDIKLAMDADVPFTSFEDDTKKTALVALGAQAVAGILDKKRKWLIKKAC